VHRGLVLERDDTSLRHLADCKSSIRLVCALKKTSTEEVFMHALFFEMRPKPGHLDHYFEHVARLRPVLAKHEGLLFLDRYRSLSEGDLLLSHQLWESEEALTAWRKDAEHRRSQSAGQYVHFADYRIRVGERILHWHSATSVTPTRADVGQNSSYVLAFYGTQPLLDPRFAAFESFNHAEQFISLANLDTLEAVETTLHSQIKQPGVKEVAAYSIRRDYGQFDRVQAPR